MEVLVAVIASVGALLAAIATVALLSRLRSEPKGWLAAWSAATAALCVSLGVVAAGHLIGFGAGTFRVYQLAGSLLAPLWLAAGVMQLLARRPAARLASWLLAGAFTVIALVIILLDPIRQEGKFGKTLPAAGQHWSWPPSYLLLAVHVIAAVILLAGLALAVMRWRGGDEYDTDNMHALLVLGPTGLALVGAVSFPVAGMFTVLLLLVTAAAVWYVVLRPLAPYEDEDEDDFDDDWDDQRPSRRPMPDPANDVRVAGRRAPSEPPPPLVPEQSARRSGLGDLVAEYRAGEQNVDYAARMQGDPSSDDPFGGPATGTFMAGEYGMPSAGHPFGGDDRDRNLPMTGQFGMPPADPSLGGPVTGEFGVPGLSSGEPGRPEQGPGAQSAPSLRPMPAEQAFGVPPAHAPTPAYPGPVAERPGGAGGSSRPSPSIFGLLTVFTLIDGTGEMFDRLAEETVEAVRRGEPDTLIYTCHSVKSAPLQRIVYEIYRDEVAYADHQRQAHVERFVAERQNMVLATNVIELNVNAAKVLPLPTAFRI
ncbi:antibiotic biosynthesis monooxygenase [Planomonospora venezuelensis]|uniref:Quinol monooxygenase YgiN/uncharacterized membrane protein YhaH (DUF805 family) n=1 Tax=Planomonospora venezuelensis TaxID=1999 RepID=A0A841CYJ7_PLAVE|nr:antibiotic biosynthesis monooxygenase [Planomonospora venezuelensis]MBB5961188.1 quinol monooxygenase YgiN/uncharacterized membrane protein YhaH (DUF805 family) [Planomonospora venezuelensis]GIM99860.1 hypothetical protein Pve01_15190 [Planomonospora venezuelensis]